MKTRYAIGAAAVVAIFAGAATGTAISTEPVSRYSDTLDDVVERKAQASRQLADFDRSRYTPPAGERPEMLVDGKPYSQWQQERYEARLAAAYPAYSDAAYEEAPVELEVHPMTGEPIRESAINGIPVRGQPLEPQKVSVREIPRLSRSAERLIASSPEVSSSRDTSKAQAKAQGEPVADAQRQPVVRVGYSDAGR